MAAFPPVTLYGKLLLGHPHHTILYLRQMDGAMGAVSGALLTKSSRAQFFS